VCQVTKHLKFGRLALLGLATLAASAVALASCGSGTSLLDMKAKSFEGGSLSNFGGADGGNTADRNIAKEMAEGRNFDFTPTGFTFASGPVSSSSEGGDFGFGGGSMAVDGDNATVDIDVTSNNPDITNAHMVGSFNTSAAGLAIVDPGKTFDVAWTISFDTLGVPVELTAIQTLAGTDFVVP